MKIVMITEGSKKWGLGHIVRCLSLYQSFEDEGAKPIIITNPDKTVKGLLKKRNYKFIDWHKNDVDLFEKIKDANIVIIDSILAPLSFYKKMSKVTNIIAYIDDTLRLDYPAGVIISRSASEKDFIKTKKSIHLFGLRFIPLTKAFWYVSDKKINQKIKKILVTFGGSDPKNATPQILKFLVEKYPNHDKLVLIGRGFETYDELKNIADVKTSFFFHPTGEDLKKIMLQADVAISASGQTLYELARVGVPTIAIKVVSNQERNIEQLLKSGFIKYVGNFDSKEALKKLEYFLMQFENKKLREEKSVLGRSLVDGYGSVRIANFLLGMANKT